MKYRIENYHDLDEWQEYVLKNPKANDLELCAIKIAEDHYFEDPCDVDMFECVVIFEDGHKYKITAENIMSFNCEEIEERKILLDPENKGGW